MTQYLLAPPFLMRLVLVGCAGLIAVMAFTTPDLIAETVRDGVPMEPVDVARMSFLRIAVSAVAAGFLLYAAIHRDSTDWRRLHRLLFAVPLAAIALVTAYKAVFGVRDAKYTWFVREDGPVEYATAVIFLVAAATGVAAFRRARDGQTRAFLALLTAATLFVGLSEISFGQRLIGIETPAEFAEINRQGEITLHNIKGVDSVVYLYGPLVLLAYAFLGGPIARWLARAPIGRPLSRDLLAVGPAPWFAVPYFIPMGIFCIKAWVWISEHTWQDQEPSELALSIGFLLIAANAFVVLGRSAGAVPAPEGLEERRLPAAQKTN